MFNNSNLSINKSGFSKHKNHTVSFFRNITNKYCAVLKDSLSLVKNHLLNAQTLAHDPAARHYMYSVTTGVENYFINILAHGPMKPRNLLAQIFVMNVEFFKYNKIYK